MKTVKTTAQCQVFRKQPTSNTPRLMPMRNRFVRNVHWERASAVTVVGICAHSVKHIRARITRHNNSTQSFKNYSTGDLCTLAERLGIKYCNNFFEKNGVNGKVLLHFSKEEFVSMLRSTPGDKCLHRRFHTAS